MTDRPSPKLRVKRLTAQMYRKLMLEFCEAIGEEQVSASYGWTDGAPRSLYSGERAYVFGHGDDVVVGWGSIILNTADGTEDEATLIVGVFPQHQRRGYRRQILDWLCAKSAQLGADVAGMVVRKENADHHRRTMREAHEEGSPWMYAGDITLPPPGLSYFARPLNDATRAYYRGEKVAPAQ